MRKNSFRWCVYILLLVVIVPLFSVVIPVNTKAFAIGDFEVGRTLNEITSIEGDFVNMKVESVDEAFKALDKFKTKFGFESSRESLKFVRKIKSVTGNVYRFVQYVGEYKVDNSEVVINVNNDGRITSINCSYYTNISKLEDIKYSILDAQAYIFDNYEASSVKYLETNVVPKSSNSLAYVFEVKMLNDIYKVFVGVSDLSVLKMVKATASLTDTSNYLSKLPSLNDYYKEDATTTYVNVDGEPVTLSIDKYVSKTSNEYFFVLGDSERAIYITHGENQTKENNAKYYTSYSASATFNDVLAVRAYDYIMQCYDFYLDSNNFGVSIEGLTNPKGEEILLLAIVHYDNKYENAAFYLPYDDSTTGYFYFGDGNTNKGTGSFVNGLDVVAHEYQHCITDSVVQLEYFNESGAICEAYSDIFGAVIEGKEMSDADFWRMGEDIYLASNKYFRDMSNPALTGCTASYSSLYPLCNKTGCSHTDCDNGGVHYNSTLMTYATYIMYQQDPTFFNSSNILKLWYQTLTKLSEDSTFIDFAQKMIQSAEELNFSEENILDIEFAFASVELPGYTGVKIWNDYTLQYLQGAGTIAKPYLINSVADLASVAYYINLGEEPAYANARYQVNVDLDLKNIPWISIGTKDNPFNGVFNGGGKTISGLNISSNINDEFAGLFNYTGDDAYIYDIRVSSGNVTTNATYAGAIAGLLKGTISGCSSDLNITGKNVGGLAGLVINSAGGEKIVNSYVTASLEGDVVGGLVSTVSSPYNASVGLHLSGYITSSYTTGTLTGNIVGGLVGKANSLYIANVLTTANLQDASGNSIVGGLVGELSFKDVNNNSDNISDLVSNMILSAKVAVSFNMQNENTKKGLLIGYFSGEATQGTLFIENVSAKKVDDINYSSNSLNTLFVKFKDCKIVEDNIFEGEFDFDNEKYYKNSSNWTILDGIEAFDLVSTFRMNGSNAMPIYIESDFWLNHASNAFDSGYGTKESPFIIKTAEQLALLAASVGSESYNNYYSTKHYKLEADIDLSGKIWVGIGTTHITAVNGVTTSATIYPFKGVFDGNGYSILNMTSLSAYSVSALNSTGTSYKLTEYLPALFGLTMIYSDGNNIIYPTIKNVSFENINNRGSYASSVVSKAYMGVNLDNISVNGGNITSNFISGGLVGVIEGLTQTYVNQEIVSNVSNSYTNVNVSGRVVGGVVGFITNASENVNTTLNVINYLNRGKISASGEEMESEIVNGSSYYYRPIAGSVVGIDLIRNLNIINSINLGDVISYNNGGYVGGFIGSIGIGGNFTSNVMNILIDGSKQIGDVYYIFDDEVLSSGSIIGGTHSELASIVNLTITEKTHTNQNVDEIANNELIGLTVNSELKYSTDVVGAGDFDIYNSEYYSNENYFNEEYFWEDAQINKIFISVTFRDHNGEIIDVIYLEQGQTSLSIEQTPMPEREPTLQYEYVFTGWDKDLNNITQSISVYAEYTTKVREYTVTYLDEKGNVIETKKLAFGSSVNQELAIPKKNGNLLFEYDFLRWGELGQTVTGDLILKPVYKRSLTFVGKVAIVSVVVFALAIFNTTKKKSKEQN